MAGFRWILLAIGLLLLLGIWWFGRRGSTQARGPALRAEADLPADAFREGEPPPVQHLHTTPIQREPSISPYEPLKVSSGEPAGAGLDIPVLSHLTDEVQPVRLEHVPEPFDATPMDDLEDTDVTHELLVEDDSPQVSAFAVADPAPPTAEAAAPDPPAPEPTPAAAPAEPPISAALAVAAETPAPGSTPAAPSAAARVTVPDAFMRSGRFARREPPPSPRTDTSGRFARVKPDSPKPIALQKIITVRVVSLAEEGWSGDDVAAALVGSELVHGRYGVFHRLHTDGRTIFYIASLVEPGSFDPALMPEQTFPGLSIFAVLPGPLAPLETLEELLSGARQIAIDLAGTIQDDQGNPLTPHKAGLMREDMRVFHGRLQDAAAT